MVRKRTLLVRSEILRLFVDILISNDKYSRHKSENLTQVIQMKISQKSKTFSGILFEFLKSTEDLEHSKKNAEPQTLTTSKSIDSEKRDY